MRAIVITDRLMRMHNQPVVLRALSLEDIHMSPIMMPMIGMNESMRAATLAPALRVDAGCPMYGFHWGAPYGVCAYGGAPYPC